MKPVAQPLRLFLALVLPAMAASAQNMDHSSMAHRVPDLHERLGTVSFPISCAPALQPSFNRGVALLHDFWYEEARAHFDRLAANDPDCAMAHWGVAMSIFHQIWDRPDDEAMKTGRAEMQKAQAPPAATPRERAYIAALAGFYQPGAKEFPARIAEYSAAMGNLYAQYPDDVDAGTFYALALMAAEAPDDT
jgi:hypothetical protein